MPNIPFFDAGLDTAMPDAPYGVSAWDACTLGGILLPGTADVRVARVLKVDEKDSPGSDGATLTPQGFKPATVKITLTTWGPNQLAILTLALQLFEPPNGSVGANGQKLIPGPVSIIHPAAQIRGVSSVLVKQITGPDPGPTKSTRVTVFECVQYFQVNRNVSATFTPTSAIQPFTNALPGAANTVGPPAPPSTIAPHP